ncbi:hypothetical protein VHA_002802 [Grimontia hollisae CIP 101886]|uniref:Pentapeptide repeat-containing protein n=2 Tax=Grimontia hollisae TaxID=673 RepID=D0IAM5_GRIHO|nr:hypothetical protein VHA_002802 [Grimontia hollisae CIP 101886]
MLNTNLQETKMYDANLQDADITGARTFYAIFEGANMEGCTGCPLDW